MAAGTEAANLFVRVTGDISDASKKLGQIGGMAEKTGGVMKGALSTAIGFGAMSVGLSAMGNAMGVVKGGVIDMNASLETSKLQFTTLMGSADKAEQKVTDLFDFAAKTPFETGPIIQASRTMQTFGGDALNTMDNLRLFGDAAAATSQPIDDVSFWMSRAYAAIQGGQPFGEARMRLMEMGILTPKVAGELEKLSASGASSSTIWGALTKDMGKFGGAMETQSQTFDGMMSTFSDSINMMLATAGKPLFDMMKGVLTNVNALMASPAFQGGMAAVATALGTAFGTLGTILGNLWTVAQPLVAGFMSFMTTVLTPMTTALSGVTLSAGGLGTTLGTLGTTLGNGLLAAAQTVVPALQGIGLKMANFVLDAIPPLINNISTFAQSMFDWLINSGVPKMAEIMGRWADTAINWLTGTAIPKLGVILPQFLGKIVDFIAKNGPTLVTKLVEWARALVGWIIPRIPELVGKLVEFGAKMVGWILTEGLPKLLSAAVDMGGALLKGIMDSILGTGGQGKGILASIVDWVTKDLIPGFLDLAPKVLKAGADLAGSMGKGFANALVGLIEGAMNAMIRGLNSFQIHFGGFDMPGFGTVARVDWNGLGLSQIHLPRFDVGSKAITGTGMAVVHKGERILPARSAGPWGGGGLRVSVQYVYSPMLSTASAAEMERSAMVLGDLIKRAIGDR